MHASTRPSRSPSSSPACALATRPARRVWIRGGPHLPDVTPSVIVGPGPGEATVSVVSSGSGRGRRRPRAHLPRRPPATRSARWRSRTASASAGASTVCRPGRLHATRSTPSRRRLTPMAAAFPADARVDENIIASQDVRHRLTRALSPPRAALVYSRRHSDGRRRARGLAGEGDRRGAGVPQAAGRHRGRRLPRHRRQARQDRRKFWVQLALASVIAAGGVIGDSTPAVIGAMIIAPLGTPIYGLALAAVDRPAPRPAQLAGAPGQRHRREHPHRRADRAGDGQPHADRREPADRRPHRADAPRPHGRRRRRHRRLVRALPRETSPTSSPAWPSPSPWCRCWPWSASRSAPASSTSRSAPSSSSSPTPRRSSSPARSCSRPPATRREAEDRDERAGRRARIAIIVLVVVLLVPLGASSGQILLYERYSRYAETATTAVDLGHRLEARDRRPVGQRDRHHRDRTG